MVTESSLPAWAKSEGQWEREIAAAERRGYVRGLEAARMSVDGALMRIGEEEGEESMKQTAWVEAPLAIQRLLARAREGE